mgnify:CR=1 FL=1
MSTEEFLKSKNDYNSKISALKDEVRNIEKERNAIEDEYIAEHREFQNGDLVNVKHGSAQISEQAYISSASQYDGIIFYRFLKVKKDGKPSSFKLYVEQNIYSWVKFPVTIELINTEYRNKNFDGTPIT